MLGNFILDYGDSRNRFIAANRILEHDGFCKNKDPDKDPDKAPV